MIVKVPLHCLYGDRGSLSKPLIASDDRAMAKTNAPGVLKSMDEKGVTGFEWHVRFRPQPGQQDPRPPVIRLMRPGLRPKTGNVMSTGAHCTDLLQPGSWKDKLSVNLVLPWLIEKLTDPDSGHSPAKVEEKACAAYSEEQVGGKCWRRVCHSACSAFSLRCNFAAVIIPVVSPMSTAGNHITG